MVARICANCGYRRVLKYKEYGSSVNDVSLVHISRFVWCCKKSLPVSARSLCGLYELYPCETF